MFSELAAILVQYAAYSKASPVETQREASCVGMCNRFNPASSLQVRRLEARTRMQRVGFVG